MRQNQKEQPNIESYKTTTELVNKIKEDDCFNSYTIGALMLMYLLINIEYKTFMVRHSSRIYSH